MSKYTCNRCGKFKTNCRKSFWQHQNRTKKCGPNRIIRESQENHIESQENHIESQENHEEAQVVVSNTTCCYCSKVFATNSNMNRHKRLYCKVKKQKEKEEREKGLIQKLLEKVQTLEDKVTKQQQQQQQQQTQQTTINNITNNNTNIQNIQNNNNSQNTQNIQLPQMTPTELMRLIAHLMIRDDYKEGLEKSVSLYANHPSGPAYGSIEALGRKEKWCLKDGELKLFNKVIEKLNREVNMRALEQVNREALFWREHANIPCAKGRLPVLEQALVEIREANPCEKECLAETEATIRNGTVYREAGEDIRELKEMDVIDKRLIKECKSKEENNKELQLMVTHFVENNLMCPGYGECNFRTVYDVFCKTNKGLICDEKQFKKMLALKTYKFANDTLKGWQIV